MASHLTPEELAYLQQLFGLQAGSPAPDGERMLLLDPAGSDAEVLARLLGAQRLSLSAEQDGFLFRFDLSVEQPPGGTPLRLRVGYPRIVERHARERALRVAPARGEVELAEASGRLSDASVRNISASGLALETESGGPLKPDEHVCMTLRLATGDQARIEGRVVRVQRQRGSPRQTLGIEFEHTDPDTRAILDRFVFHHYPALAH